MARSFDHPELEFVQASGYTPGRADGPPLWIVVHDMEAGEDSDRAENTAAYFASGAGGRDVSSHYCADNDSVIQCVHLSDTAWTVGNRPGNNRGINWEFAGFASQTGADWLDDFGVAMLTRAAPIIRADAARYGIPLERRTVAELQDFVPGITSHNDLRLAFGVTDHTDPGPNFPWDWFIALLNGAQPIGESTMQILVRFSDAPIEAGGPDQVWLADGMFRRRVPSEMALGDSVTDGLIGNNGTHNAGVLGPLGNGGQVFVSVWSGRDAWGQDLATLGGSGAPVGVTFTYSGSGKLA